MEYTSVTWWKSDIFLNLNIYIYMYIYVYCISPRRSNPFCNRVMFLLSHDCERKILLRRSMSYVLRDKFRNCREQGTFSFPAEAENKSSSLIT